MNATEILIAACAITFLSLILKFIKLKRENVSIFLDIEKKGDEIMREIVQQRRVEEINKTLLQHFRLAISDWFSAIAIIVTSYLLLYEYLNIGPLTKMSVFKIGLLFTLLLFNIIFLAVSIIERRLGYWIDQFTTIVKHILEIMRQTKSKVSLKKSESGVNRTRVKKKRRR